MKTANQILKETLSKKAFRAQIRVEEMIGEIGHASCVERRDALLALCVENGTSVAFTEARMALAG